MEKFEEMIAAMKLQMELDRQRMEQDRLRFEEEKRQREDEKRQREEEMKLQAQRYEDQRREDQKRFEAQRHEDQERFEAQRHEDKKRYEELLAKVGTTTRDSFATSTKFDSFNPTVELWKDYYNRFITFVKANNVPEDKIAQIFLTNQSTEMYATIRNLVEGKENGASIQDVSKEELFNLMSTCYDAKKYVVRERTRFWNESKKREGETSREFATRIVKLGATCDFDSIEHTRLEAFRTAFVAGHDNEAIVKACLALNDKDLTFEKAIEIAESQEALTKNAKALVYGKNEADIEVHKVNKNKSKNYSKPKNNSTSTPRQKDGKASNSVNCYRCAKSGHRADTCKYKNAQCNYCKRTGHLEAACRKKAQSGQAGGNVNVNKVSKEEIKKVKVLTKKKNIPKMQADMEIKGTKFKFELDTGACANFSSRNKARKAKVTELCIQVRICYKTQFANYGRIFYMCKAIYARCKG